VLGGPQGTVPPYANAPAQHPQPGYPQAGSPQSAPYGQSLPPGYAQPGYSQPAYPQPAPSAAGAYPLSSSAPPPPRSGGRNLAVVLSIVGAMAVLVVVGVAVAVGLILGSSPATPIAVPSPTSVAPEGGQPSEPSAAPDGGSDAPADPDAGADIADRLSQKIDDYKRLRDSGELWQSIPDTEFNRTAVSAFLYFLADMKAATIWGVDAATADEYEQRMTMLEERLLAEQPLGDDIEITFEDEVFTYDGETGEGGYTPK
jgi:hypothetical protein